MSHRLALRGSLRAFRRGRARSVIQACLGLFLGLFLGLWLAGCAHTLPGAPPEALLHDELFSPVPDQAPAESPDEAAVFALSDAMRRYAETTLAASRDPRQALLDALTRKDGLRLGYDAERTRNAAQAFEARAGNCLSLVIMTSAFARHLGVPAHYQAVQVEDNYTRVGDLTFVSGHVNLVLGRQSSRSAFASSRADELTVDFMPGSELRGQRTQPLTEQTVLAMYFNNRAAEALADGRVAAAYTWARAAVLRDPAFAAAVNTLAVIYLRGGHLAAAEAALRHVLAREPENAGSLNNLVLVLQRAGRGPEAELALQRLAQVQPEPPFQNFELGRQAMAQGKFQQARDLFERELRRQPAQAEVHFWTAMANWQLGNASRTARHLRLAVENSTTLASHDLYAAKLARLRELQLQ